MKEWGDLETEIQSGEEGLVRGKGKGSGRGNSLWEDPEERKSMVWGRGWAVGPGGLRARVYVQSEGNTGGQMYHVVVIEEAQGRDAVIIPIDSHHGLRGGCQWVFQVGLPGLILTRVRELLEVDWVILQQSHRPETGRQAGKVRFRLSQRKVQGRSASSQCPGIQRVTSLANLTLLLPHLDSLGQ